MQQIRNVLMLLTISILLGSWTLPAKTAQGILNDKTLMLANATAITRSTAQGNTHYFTMTLPRQAGKRFATLSFSFNEQHQEKRIPAIQFDLAKTQAFVGTPKASRGTIVINRTWIDETGTVWVEFNSAIAAKTVLTVALKTQKLPPNAVYQYGIAAYPATARPVAVFVGDGTLTTGR